MGAIQPKEFANEDEEIEYWKNIAIEYKEKIDRAQDKWDQLEEEYISALIRNEQEMKELKTTYEIAHNEKLSRRTVVEFCSMEVKNLKTKIETLENEKQVLTEKVIELENNNDDLEEFRDITEENMFFYKQALKEHANSETELDETEMQEKLQELQDLVQDLKQALDHRETKDDFYFGIFLQFLVFLLPLGIFAYKMLFAE